MRMASLQDVVTGANRKNEVAFLLHERNALGAGAYVEMAGFETVEFHAAGKRSDGSGNQAQQGGFAAGVRAEYGYEGALACLTRRGFQSKGRRCLFSRRI